MPTRKTSSNVQISERQKKPLKLTVTLGLITLFSVEKAAKHNLSAPNAM